MRSTRPKTVSSRFAVGWVFRERRAAISPAVLLHMRAIVVELARGELEADHDRVDIAELRVLQRNMNGDRIGRFGDLRVGGEAQRHRVLLLAEDVACRIS